MSLLGDGMINVALAFAVLEVAGSASDVGLVFAVRLVPMVLALLAGGVVPDRLSRRAVMVAADLVRVAAQGATAALLIAGSASVGSLAVLAGVTGAATGFFLPAGTGLLPAVVTRGTCSARTGCAPRRWRSARSSARSSPACWLRRSVRAGRWRSTRGRTS